MPKRTQFSDALLDNKYLYNKYFKRLTELSLSMFEWVNFPNTCDTVFLERVLFMNGSAVFFEDDVMGYLNLPVTFGGGFDVYNVPMRREAYASNSYNKKLDRDDSVIIYNNMLRTNTYSDIIGFAKTLAELDQVITVNCKAQKTPILITCPEKLRLSLLQMYQKYEGNEPVIFGNKNLDLDSIKAIVTGAPFVADKLYLLKTQIWNEALTYLGISNMKIEKRQRMSLDEVNRLQGGTIASRYSRLEARRQACRQINEMFGLDTWVDYREDEEVDTENLDNDIHSIQLMNGGVSYESLHDRT